MKMQLPFLKALGEYIPVVVIFPFIFKPIFHSFYSTLYVYDDSMCVLGYYNAWFSDFSFDIDETCPEEEEKQDYLILSKKAFKEN